MKTKKTSKRERKESRKQKRRKERDSNFVTNHRPSPSSGICLALSLVCMLVSLLRLTFGPFEIREYSITNDSPYSLETVSETIGNLSEKNYLTLDKEEVSKTVSDALPYIKGLEFDFNLPFKMEIRVIPEQIKYYSERKDGLYVFNEDLKLIETRSIEDAKSDLDGITKLHLPSEMTISNEGFPEFEFSFKASDIVSLAEDIVKTKDDSTITSIDFSDSYNIKFVLDEKYLICFGGLDERSEKLNDITEIFKKCAPKMFEDRTLRIDVSVSTLPTYTFDINIYN